VVEFDLSAQRLAALLEAGRHAVAAYFDQPLPSAAAAGEAGPAVTPSSDVIDRRARDILA
jgi:hypothetical protein